MRYLVYLSFCCLYNNPKGRGYKVPIFPKKRFLGFTCPTLGACRMLFVVSFNHFVVNFLSQLKHILALADHISPFGCVQLCGEGKVTFSRERLPINFSLGRRSGSLVFPSLLLFIYLFICLFIYHIFLLVSYGIVFKHLFVHKSLNGLCPQYLTNLLEHRKFS